MDHGRQALFHRPFAVNQVDHGRIEPDRRTVQGVDALVPFLAFSDDGRRDDVTRFQGMEEGFAVLIDQHGPEGTDFFRNQCPVNLRRIGGTRRMVLDSVGIDEGYAGTVSQDQAVCRRTVVVGRREALIVQAAGTARSDNDALGANYMILLRIKIIEDGTGCLPFPIEEEFHSRRIFDDIDAGIAYFIAQDAHDFCARIVTTGMHALARRTAAVGRDHGAVGFLIEEDA